jgi:hypothetical protein
METLKRLHSGRLELQKLDSDGSDVTATNTPALYDRKLITTVKALIPAWLPDLLTTFSTLFSAESVFCIVLAVSASASVHRVSTP